MRHLKLHKGHFMIHKKQIVPLNKVASVAHPIQHMQDMMHNVHISEGEGMHKKKHHKGIKPLHYKF